MVDGPIAVCVAVATWSHKTPPLSQHTQHTYGWPFATRRCELICRWLTVSKMSDLEHDPHHAQAVADRQHTSHPRLAALLWSLRHLRPRARVGKLAGVLPDNQLVKLIVLEKVLFR